MNESKNGNKNYKSLVHWSNPNIKVFNNIDKEIEYIVKENKGLNNNGVKLRDKSIAY